MNDFLRYVPFILAALAGIGGVIFNTKRDVDPTKPIVIFNKPTKTGYVALAFVLLSLFFSIYLFNQDRKDKAVQLEYLTREKTKDSLFKESNINFLKIQVKLQEKSIAEGEILNKKISENKTLDSNNHEIQTALYKSESQILQNKLSNSEIKIEDLSKKNVELKDNLNQQMEVSFFSMLNQTLIEPEATLTLYTKYNFPENDKIKEYQALPDSISRQFPPSEYLNSETRKLLMPHENLIWKDPSGPRGDFLLFSFNFNLTDLWRFYVYIFNYGKVFAPSIYSSDIAASSDITHNNHFFSTTDKYIFIINKQKTKANCATLYNSLLSSKNIFSFQASFKNSVSNKQILDILNGIKNNIDSITLSIPINKEANLGFLVPLIYSQISIDTTIAPAYKIAQIHWKSNQIPRLAHY